MDELKEIFEDFKKKIAQKPPSKEMVHADNEIVRHTNELGKIHERTSKLVVQMNAMFSEKVDELARKVEEFEKRLAAENK
jgi:hypothetical protein